MELKLVRHLWGVDHTHGLEHFLPRWREVGYSAIEASIRIWPDRSGLVQFLSSIGWDWIPQVFSNDFLDGRQVSGKEFVVG